MTTLTTKATNEGTYILTCTFTDADGTAVTPNALTWTLCDGSGTVVHSRRDVIVSPAASVSIVLTADDIDTEDGWNRVFTIEGNYNSATYGNNLPIREQATFNIGEWREITPA